MARREPAVRRARRSGRLSLPRFGPIPWRVVSLLLVLLLAGAGAGLFLNPSFYVSQVEVGGNRYMPPEEVYARSGIAGFHILWVEPERVAEAVAESPSIESAQVSIFWPARVQIRVREREPAVVWQQADSAFWVDVNGNLMVARRELPDLVRIVNQGDSIPFRCPGPGCPPGEEDVTLQPPVIAGALQIKTLRPDVSVLYYSEAIGLSFDDPRGWRVHMGTGVNMDVKLTLYERVVADVLSRGLTPTEVDVSAPDAPFYRTQP
ncbi:MAG: FtsQ-type POTRA domain-containing protein [Chloroflexi bacterium]|nr:FtsQ-type POTRA domain-containing protein [Chloroflexota bacterium]